MEEFNDQHLNMFTYILTNKEKIDTIISRIKTIIDKVDEYNNNIYKYILPSEKELLDCYLMIYRDMYNLQMIVNTWLNYTSKKEELSSCLLNKSYVLNHKVQYENDIISVRIEGILPTKIPSKQEYVLIKQYWMETIAYAIKSLKLPKFTEKIFVKIKFHIRNWSDLDNRFIKFLIDGIRYSTLIVDDDYKHVSYMVDGIDIEKNNEEYTEMFITTFENKSNIIDL